MPKLSIRTRLGVAILSLSVLLCVIGALGVTGMARSNDANRETYENRLVSTRLIGDAELSISRERTTVDRIAFDPTAPTVDKDVATYRMLKGQGMEPGSNTCLCPLRRLKAVSLLWSTQSAARCRMTWMLSRIRSRAWTALPSNLR